MNILIVEDEPKSARLLVELIKIVKPDCKVVAVCAGIEDTVAFIKDENTPIDVYFMDIHVSDGMSFEIFNRVKIEQPVVFCTAYDEYALNAFKVDAIDYILKPFQQHDIERVFVKIIKIQNSSSRIQFEEIEKTNRMLTSFKSYTNTFLVDFRGKKYPIQSHDITVFCIEEGVVYVYTNENKKYSISKTIDTIETLLDPDLFFRINRQIIINRWGVQAIKYLDNRKIFIKPTIEIKEEIIVSRLRVPAFNKWLNT